jgi:hypothetical protein
MRIHTNTPPRVERFKGVESRGVQSLNHTLLFVGGKAPVDPATLGEGRRKADELFSRLHPDAIPFQATSPGSEPKIKIVPPRETLNGLEYQRDRGFVEHFTEIRFPRLIGITVHCDSVFWGVVVLTGEVSHLESIASH